MIEVSFLDIRKLLSDSVISVKGNTEKSISFVGPINITGEKGISFCNKKGEEGKMMILNSKAGIIITIPEHKDLNPKNSTIIYCNNPRLAIIKVINAFFQEINKISRIHPTVIIGKNSIIEDNVYIGPYVNIGNQVVIGNGSIIESNVYIEDNVKIGRNCEILNGAVIGSKALAYEKNLDDSYIFFPQLGSVIIGDEVNIGAHTVIMRGTFENTIIDKGTKIGCFVSIGHNCIIGKNCMIINFCCIQGSAVIENDVWLSAHSCIRNGIRVGERAFVGMGAIVTNDVESGMTVVGNPAKPLYKK